MDKDLAKKQRSNIIFAFWNELANNPLYPLVKHVDYEQEFKNRLKPSEIDDENIYEDINDPEICWKFFPFPADLQPFLDLVRKEVASVCSDQLNAFKLLTFEFNLGLDDDGNPD